MKTKVILLALTIILFVSFNAFSQTITVTSVSKTQFCVGDEFTVDYIATGTFDDDNVFVVQLSYPDGDFSRFQNIGNLKTVNSGTVSCKIPEDCDSNKTYKLRIMSSKPYIVSDVFKDNLSIFRYGYPSFEISSQFSLPNLEIKITNEARYSISCYWEFGDDAVPPNYAGWNPPPVKFLTPGKKWMRLYANGEGNCTKSQTKYLTILECNVKIDSSAKVIDTIINENTSHGSYYWICSNGVYNCNDAFYGKAIYMEAGATANIDLIEASTRIYMKPGACLNINYGWYMVVLYSDASSINCYDNITKLKCDDLEFDYSEAPVAGKIAQHLDVDDATSLNNLNIFPNPSDGLLNISLNSEAPIFTITIFDVLGNVIFSNKIENMGGSWNGKIDLSGNPSGIYFIKFSNISKNIIKKIIRN
ncbi:MAG: T9SS type A sorting domain-containing protein [bacterium]